MSRGISCPDDLDAFCGGRIFSTRSEMPSTKARRAGMRRCRPILRTRCTRAGGRRCRQGLRPVAIRASDHRSPSAARRDGVYERAPPHCDKPCRGPLLMNSPPPARSRASRRVPSLSSDLNPGSAPSAHPCRSFLQPASPLPYPTPQRPPARRSPRPTAGAAFAPHHAGACRPATVRLFVIPRMSS